MAFVFANVIPRARPLLEGVREIHRLALRMGVLGSAGAEEQHVTCFCFIM